ncbi:hypothetical protein QBC37DRAFT_427317 [Rhypophila decipiens]|uniref:NECAP PHear domain-containing protein n=1 Tax=Rhypophila decipiens TaxID=261697 RepID=A0AAN6Y285_9PEZI|nr:hypothetical protein QBC37DRAFT_427317 [Rhypophila decipiens]
MDAIDPATGLPLPADAIQRVLHIARAVHVYHIPPLTSTKGYTAATWTEDPKRHLATCRARIIETAIPVNTGDGPSEKLKVDIVLEDSSTGQLFAASPYTAPSVVEPALDSSRFFALIVQDPAGRKATLGIGFEERSEAFDFSIALQEAQKALGISASGSNTPSKGAGQQQKSPEPKKDEWLKRDYSLKDGETITVNLSGTSFGRNKGARASPSSSSPQEGAVSLSSFALPPPPGPGGGSSGGFLPPPPSAKESRSRKRLSAQQLGFDDGQFGEFA